MNPTLYHAHHQSYTEDLAYWQSLAETNPGALLELGCGTGRVLTTLVKQGFQITGLDNDSQALAFLTDHLEETNISAVRLIHSDLTNFSVAQRFSLIILPCNTYSTLDNAQRLATLKTVSQHLAPGGVFAVSMPNPGVINQLPGNSPPEEESSFIHPQSHNPVSVMSGWQKRSKRWVLDWHYDHLFSDGQVERSTITVVHHIEDPATHMKEWKDSGFSVLQYGDFKRSDFNQDSQYLILQGEINP
ncbi:MAG: class I SAM-dependent methyltransferase [Chloroflexota bacterium]